jgi:hypothetical protein
MAWIAITPDAQRENEELKDQGKREWIAKL